MGVKKSIEVDIFFLKLKPEWKPPVELQVEGLKSKFKVTCPLPVALSTLTRRPHWQPVPVPPHWHCGSGTLSKNCQCLIMMPVIAY